MDSAKAVDVIKNRFHMDYHESNSLSNALDLAVEAINDMESIRKILDNWYEDYESSDSEYIDLIYDIILKYKNRQKLIG